MTRQRAQVRTQTSNLTARQQTISELLTNEWQGIDRVVELARPTFPATTSDRSARDTVVNSLNALVEVGIAEKQGRQRAVQYRLMADEG